MSTSRGTVILPVFITLVILVISSLTSAGGLNIPESGESGADTGSSPSIRAGYTDRGPYGYTFFNASVKSQNMPPDSSDDDIIELRVWLPKVTTQRPFPLVIGAPGAGGTQYDLNVLGDVSATWGVVFVAGGFRTTGSVSVDMFKKCPGEVLDWVLEKNADPESQLYGMVAEDQYGFFGFSNGGLYMYMCSYDPRFKLALGDAPVINTQVIPESTYVNKPPITHYVWYDMDDWIIDAGQNIGFFHDKNVAGQYHFIITDGGGHDPGYIFYTRIAQGARYFLAHDESQLSNVLGNGVKSTSGYGSYYKTRVWDNAPVALRVSKTALNTGESATFSISTSDISAMLDEHPMANLEIDFEGDGTYDWSSTSGTSTTHSYSSNGLYYPKARLTVTDWFGDPATGTSFGELLVNVGNMAVPPPPGPPDPPTLSIDGSPANSATVDEDQEIAFSAAPGGGVSGAQFKWDWGDGESTSYTTGQSGSHAYTDKGVYETKCMMAADGYIVESSATITVNNVAPGVQADPAGGPYDEGDTVTFGGSGDDTTSDLASLSYTWDFGDGESSSPASTAAATHVYTTADTFTATLTVTDDDGATATDSVDVTVNNAPPDGTLSVTTTDPVEGEPVSLVLTPIIGSWEEADTSYIWNFGDGTSPLTNTEKTMTHTYGDDGLYTAKVTINDGEDTADITTKVEVANDPPVIVVEGLETEYTEGDTLSLDATGSTDVDMDIADLTYQWEFMDTTYDTGTMEVFLDRSESFTITLTVSDDGGQSVWTQDIDVLNVAPVAEFTASEDTILPWESIVFDASATTDTQGDQELLQYQWDFGDGSQDEGVSVEHTFERSGEFTVKLTVTDPDGAEHTKTTTITVLETEIDPEGDSDEDCITDGWELANFGSVEDCDPGSDDDSDGLSNLEEFQERTDPAAKDSDGDGLTDGDEVNVHKTNPLLEDSDGNGIPDFDEVQEGTDTDVPDDTDPDDGGDDDGGDGDGGDGDGGDGDGDGSGALADDDGNDPGSGGDRSSTSVSDSGGPDMLMIGGIIAAVVVILAVVVLMFFVKKKGKKKQDQTAQTTPTGHANLPAQTPPVAPTRPYPGGGHAPPVGSHPVYNPQQQARGQTQHQQPARQQAYNPPHPAQSQQQQQYR